MRMMRNRIVAEGLVVSVENEMADTEGLDGIRTAQPTGRRTARIDTESGHVVTVSGPAAGVPSRVGQPIVVIVQSFLADEE